MKMKDKREMKNMTQKELAEKSEIDIRLIQSYEQGRRDINKASAISVWKLAKALECSVEEILELKGYVEQNEVFYVEKHNTDTNRGDIYDPMFETQDAAELFALREFSDLNDEERANTGISVCRVTKEDLYDPTPDAEGNYNWDDFKNMEVLFTFSE